jgi:hypothetical protein
VNWGVQNDLAPLSGHRRPSIREELRVVVVGCFEAPGTKGAFCCRRRRRHRGAGLPMSDDVDPGPGERIPTYVTACCRDWLGGGVVGVHPGIMAVDAARLRHVPSRTGSGLTYDVAGE